MLVEGFIAATLTPERQVNTANLGVHVYDLQPLSALRSTFKKSSSNGNSVAANKTHIFAAQAEKAVVHVYNRDHGNQEATVPFPERLHSLALAGEKDGAGILVLGTGGGRLILWELGTGRQIFTPQHHLQPVTCLAADPSSNFLLSGSPDSNLHVWSILNLLSFSASHHKTGDQDLPFSPLRSLSAHRTGITAIAFGHSISCSSIAVSASKDGTCVIWDYSDGIALHTYLLTNSPLCIALDPVDRALYAGYADGSIQLVDFYETLNSTNPLHDPASRATPSQPLETGRWTPPNGNASPVLSMGVSYDGTLLLSGDANGKINSWDIAAGRFQKEMVDLSAPITNLIMLPPEGFHNEPQPSIKLHKVVKPQYESFTAGSSLGDTVIVPSNYTFSVQLKSNISIPDPSDHSSFQKALTNPLFSTSLLEEGIAELSSSNDFGDRATDSIASEHLRNENAALSSRLENVLAQYQKAEATSKARDRADWIRKQDEAIKETKKKKRRLLRIRAEEVLRKKEMGEQVEIGDEDVKEEEEGYLSSSTDED